MVNELNIIVSTDVNEIAIIVIFLVVLLGVAALIASIIIPLIILNKKYKQFVLSNSQAIKELNQINLRYQFYEIPNLDLEHSYDSKTFYSTISCKDYLIYNLAADVNRFQNALRKVDINRTNFKRYKREIENKCIFNNYGEAPLLQNQKKLEKIEKKEIQKLIKTPRIYFSIQVILRCNDAGTYAYENKMNVFTEDEINELIKDVNKKNDTWYLMAYIWDAICRVERGKVTNKLRFAIYERDNYTCQMCGKRNSNDLEIDHIIPISKGGKTTYDNLQTLCHDCNKKKGNKLI